MKLRLSLLLLLSLLCLASCSEIQRGKIPSECRSGRSEFVPIGVFDPQSKQEDERSRNAYSALLNAMKEPSLLCGNEVAETYRFLWLRSFHHPIAVRIERSGDGISLEAVELSETGSYPSSVLHRAKRTLSSQDWAELQALLVRSDFWKLPTKRPDDSILMMDGAGWIVEGRREGVYHIVNRDSRDGGDYRALGLLFLRLSGFSVPPSDIY